MGCKGSGREVVRGREEKESERDAEGGVEGGLKRSWRRRCQEENEGLYVQKKMKRKKKKNERTGVR